MLVQGGLMAKLENSFGGMASRRVVVVVVYPGIMYTKVPKVAYDPLPVRRNVASYLLSCIIISMYRVQLVYYRPYSSG